MLTQLMGIVIGLYIITKMLSVLCNNNEHALVHIAAGVAVSAAAFVTIILCFGSSFLHSSG